jgi:DNA-binding XRE family transcriptional regulator
MSDADNNRDALKPPPAFLEALARYKERRRLDPNWDPQTEYRSPNPVFSPMMTEAECKRYAARVEERRGSSGNRQEVDLQKVRQDEPTPRPRVPVRAALPFGQRIRDLRRALGWTQREVAWHLGVSARSIIRYEQGRSAPLQSAPLLALRRLEAQAVLNESGRKLW